MLERTRNLWEQQHGYDPNRRALFEVVEGAVRAGDDAVRVLYPGSWVDISASFVFADVTYVDSDRQAATFFADADGVGELIAEQVGAPSGTVFEFIDADYTSDLPVVDGSFDLLVSLYAGFISTACTRYLRIGGHLLVNGSHGDAAMASLDPRYELVGVLLPRSGGYRLRSSDLGGFMQPKRDVEITPESLRASGRGVAYTKPAFAYLFRRIV